ncbi:MAG: aminoacetone oxidase family FAD-binding enzyme [Oscillospiraceae bacterium]|nr:aminoacetone oxidase family FAD-binding enzyme [Oscillospiraceae bacterium]
MFSTIIIGGGAAGLAAATFLARRLPEGRVLVLEKGARVGKKLLATGNGSCNLSNKNTSAANYHGADPAFVSPALAAFPPEAAMDFFASIGVICKTRTDGRVYPLCEQAAAVLDALRLAGTAGGRECHCEIRNDMAVTGLRRGGDNWTVSADSEEFSARCVLVAAGGAASPSLGGGNDGYRLLESAGHQKLPLFPAIVPIKTDTAYIKAMQGIRVNGTAALLHNGKPLAAETGEILFTAYGLSGPAVMRLGRAAADWERRREGELTVSLNLLPGWNPDRLTDELARRRLLPSRTAENWLTGLLHSRVGQTVVRRAGLSLTRPLDSLVLEEIRAAAGTALAFPAVVEGTAGWSAAQVTAGGIATAEFDPVTMQSRLAPGLFAAGEVLDIDGDCGGYNLQWAWSSANAAAEGILRYLRKK